MSESIEIFEIKSFCTDNGMEVKELVGSQGTVRHMGAAVINAGGRLAPVEFPFEDGLTLSQCFEKFEEAITKHLKEMQDRQREQNLIIKPGDNMKPNNGFSLV